MMTGNISERPPAAQASASARLRESTADLHEAVEERVRVTDRLTSLEGYTWLLRYFLAAVRPVERAIASRPASAELAGPASIGGVELLLNDLRTMGVKARPGDGRFPLAEGEAALLGTMYVLEGSALGGRVIARMAEERLNVRPETGSSFFSRGAETRGGWPAFKTRLDTRLRDEDEIVAAVAAARQTFAHFLQVADQMTPA